MLAEQEKAHSKMEFTVSTGTILKIAAVLLVLWFVYVVRDIIGIFFVALIFSSIIDPLADWLEARKVPRSVAVLIVYVIIFSILGLVIGLLVPPLVQEVRDLASNFSAVWDRLVSGAALFREYSVQSGFSKNIEQGLGTILSNLTQALGGAFSTIVGVFGGIVSFVFILVLTFYMVTQEDLLKRTFKILVPDNYQTFAFGILGKIQRKITAWVKGQLILSLSVGILSFVGLSIIGVNYALVLGIFAAITELVPYAGPFLGGTVAVFFALSQSASKAIFTIILFIIVQQLENNILVPKVMQRAVGLNPIVSILALIIGMRLAGIPGALFAIPVATALDLVAREVLHGGHKKE